MKQPARFAIYDSFSEQAFGGSQVCVVSGAAHLNPEERAQLAKEIGHPATAFLTAVEGMTLSATFNSTVMELPMCGHGTIGLMTRLYETGEINLNGRASGEFALYLPTRRAAIEVTLQSDLRPLVMLNVDPPSFHRQDLDRTRLSALLGIELSSISTSLPIEIAQGDFLHLVIPLVGLSEMRQLSPDFSGLASFCHEAGVDTVATFSLETCDPTSTLHVRDFCPAVGVAESAAAGTTNAALTSYLLRHGLVPLVDDGDYELVAEQGVEIGRPSRVRSRVTMEGGKIASLKVGGVATKVAEGIFYLGSAALA